MRVELSSVKAESYELDDVNFSDSELDYHIRDALKSVSSGNSDSYEQLVGGLHHRTHLAPDEVAWLVTSLKALSGAVSCIDTLHHDALLSSIFGMSMWDYGPDVMDALLELIVSLAAVDGKYVDSCLNMLVSNFKPPYSFLDILKQPRGLAKKDQVLSRVHSAFKDISYLVPLAPSRLGPIVLGKIPHVSAKETAIMIYVENMLRLESGPIGEIVGSMMLKALMCRLIDLDIGIPWEWDPILQDDTNKGIFEMELEDADRMADESDEDEQDDEFPRESLTRKSLRGNVIAEQLDSLLVLTFEHLESCKAGGRLSEVFETLLESFEETVLDAHKSKFAQFVMFYACALDPENCGVKFAMMLADIFVSGDKPPLIRMIAVSYLASYLSRGKFLSASFVVSILKRLVDWCLEYCNNRDVDADPEAHRVFYSGCQAIMYVLCFHLRSIMFVPRLKSQLLLTPIEPILKHKLNPLKVCLPSVVEEFLRQAKAACLFTVSETFIFNDLLESDVSRAFGGVQRLDMFFPFDPCLLRKSDSFIRPNFVYWSMAKTIYDDDECSSDEDLGDKFMDSHRENFNDDGMGRSFDEQDLDIDDFGDAWNMMSISPKNNLKYRFAGGLQEAPRMPSRIRPSASPESL